MIFNDLGKWQATKEELDCEAYIVWSAAGDYFIQIPGKLNLDLLGSPYQIKIELVRNLNRIIMILDHRENGGWSASLEGSICSIRKVLPKFMSPRPLSSCFAKKKNGLTTPISRTKIFNFEFYNFTTASRISLLAQQLSSWNRFKPPCSTIHRFLGTRSQQKDHHRALKRRFAVVTFVVAVDCLILYYCWILNGLAHTTKTPIAFVWVVANCITLKRV